MSSATDTTGNTTRTARMTFFCVSGPLPPDRPGYIERDIDVQLLESLRAGRVVNIVGAPLSGKTSLLLRTAHVLREQDDGPLVAFIDMRQLAERDTTSDIARWFYAIAYRIVRQLRASLDLQTWWADHAMLPLHQRFVELYRELLLGSPGRAITLLFDDMHLLQAHSDGDALYASFRALLDARGSDPSLSRISIGFCNDGSGQFRHSNAARMPFDMAQHISVENFTLSQSLKLSPALGLPRDQAELTMQRVHDWVAGHPALTQALAADIAALPEIDANVSVVVDQMVSQRFNKTRRSAGHPALVAIERQVVNAPLAIREPMLLTLGQIAKRGRVLFDPESEAHDRLLALGALQLAPDGYLIAGSRLLRRFLNGAWASRHLPARLNGVFKAAAVLALCIGLPLWYRVLLPKPYIATLMAPESDVATLIDTARHLAIWPGYRRHAERILHNRLSARVGGVGAVQQQSELIGPLESLGEYPVWVDEFQADFWQRQLVAAQRRGDRAAAIDALLNILPHRDTAALRRRLTALIGSDLDALDGILSADSAFDTLVYRPLDGALIARTGLQIDEWLPGQSRGDWQLQRSLLPKALRATPVVIALPQPAVRDARRLQLTLKLAHERLSDITLRITTPDGRSAAIPVQSLGVESGLIELRLDTIAALRDQLRNIPEGDWTLSVSDQRPGMRGGVTAVSLGAVTASEASVLSIPDPQVVAPASVHVTPRGRFAIALPTQPDMLGAIWDLRRRRLIASVPVSDSARLLGFGDGGRQALFIDGVTLTGFRLGDGGTLTRKAFENPVRQAWLSETGRWMALLSVDEQPRLLLFDLENNERIAVLSVGDDIRHLAVARNGSHVAVVGADHVARVWQVRSGEPVASLDIGQPALDVNFVDSDAQLVIRGVSGGMLAWVYGSDTAPLRWDDRVRWSFAHDRQSGLSLVGSRRDGYRVHDFSKKRDRSLPFFGFASGDEYAALLRLRDNIAVVAAPVAGRATVWRPKLAALPTGRQRVATAWLSPDASVIAFTDGDERYQVMRTDAGVEELSVLDEDVAVVRHSTAPRMVRFGNGERVLSIESNGLFRIFDGRLSRFHAFLGRAGTGVTDAAFDQSGQYVAIGRAATLMIVDSASGAIKARNDADSDISAISALPEPNRWIVFYKDGEVTVVSVTGDNAQQIDSSRRLRVSLQANEVASGVRGLTAVAAGSALQVLNHGLGELAGLPLIFDTPVNEMRFSDNGQYLVVRVGQWLHRLRIDMLGAHIVASRLLPVDAVTHRGFALLDARANGVRLLAGLDEPEPRDVWFDHRDQNVTTGSPESLTERWQVVEGLRGAAP